jgi:uncharacterized protein YjbI with pentapeptide repeats
MSKGKYKKSFVSGCHYYDAFSGNYCQEPVIDKETKLCFWHARINNKPHIKEKFVERVGNGEELAGAYLVGVDLSGIKLKSSKIRDIYLRGSNLAGAKFFLCDLRNSNLQNSNFQGASLQGCDLKEADLSRCNLKDTRLSRANLQRAILEGAIWNHRYICIEEKEKDSRSAIDVYREIKNNYSNSGNGELAGAFYYREMEVKRKTGGSMIPRVSLTLFWLTCGYGERPFRVVACAAFITIFLALIYMLTPMLDALTYQYFTSGVFSINDHIQALQFGKSWTSNAMNIGNAIYFSTVTFTTLGYGDYLPIGLAKIFSALEAFLGAFMLALFVFVFTRKMLR